MKKHHDGRARLLFGTAILFFGMGAGAILAAPPTSGLVAWYKADAGLTTNSAGVISQWDDQSGSGNHATQTNTAAQPQAESVLLPIGFRPVVTFGSAGGYDQFNLPNIRQCESNGATVYFVVNDDPDSARSSVYWLNRSNATAPAIFGRSSATTKSSLYYSSNWRAEATPVPSGWKIARFAWDGSGSSTLVTNLGTRLGAYATTATPPSITSFGMP